MVISQEKLFPLMEVIKPKLQNRHATLGSEMKIHGHKKKKGAHGQRAIQTKVRIH